MGHRNREDDEVIDPAHGIAMSSRKANGLAPSGANPLLFLVGVAGFELATPCTPCKCATRLRYTPTLQRSIAAAVCASGPEQAAYGNQFVTNVSASQRCFWQFRRRRLCVDRGTANRNVIVRLGGLIVRRATPFGDRRALSSAVRQAVARATDREALFVKQVADTTDQQHFVVLVVAPVAAPLHRLELGKYEPRFGSETAAMTSASKT